MNTQFEVSSIITDQKQQVLESFSKMEKLIAKRMKSQLKTQLRRQQELLNENQNLKKQTERQQMEIEELKRERTEKDKQIVDLTQQVSLLETENATIVSSMYESTQETCTILSNHVDQLQQQIAQERIGFEIELKQSVEAAKMETTIEEHEENNDSIKELTDVIAFQEDEMEELKQKMDKLTKDMNMMIEVNKILKHRIDAMKINNRY